MFLRFPQTSSNTNKLESLTERLSHLTERLDSQIGKCFSTIQNVTQQQTKRTDQLQQLLNILQDRVTQVCMIKIELKSKLDKISEIRSTLAFIKLKYASFSTIQIGLQDRR